MYGEKDLCGFICSDSLFAFSLVSILKQALAGSGKLRLRDLPHPAQPPAAKVKTPGGEGENPGGEGENPGSEGENPGSEGENPGSEGENPGGRS